MRPVTSEDWTLAYQALKRVALHRSQGDTPPIVDMLRDLFVSVEAPEPERFGDAVGERLSGLRDGWRSMEDARSDDPLGGFWTVRAKCGRIARLVCEGNGHLVPGPDRAWVRDALSAAPTCAHLAGDVPLPPPPSAALPTDGGPVTYSLGRTATARDGLGSSRVTVRERRVAHVGRLDPGAAPVVCRLARPGGTLDVRLHEGVFLRPVLSPGSWEPVSHADFVRHADEAPPWADNPFLARPRHGSTPMGLGEYEVVPIPGPSARGARTLLTPGGSTLAVRPRDGAPPRLHVIDGVVHRETARPTLAVLHRRTVAGFGFGSWCDVDDPSDGYVLAWRLGGDLDQAASQATVNPTTPFPRWDLGGSDRRLGLARPVFELGDAAKAREFVRLRSMAPAARETRNLVPHKPSHVTYPWHLGAPDPVSDVDPVAFPPDPLAVTRVLSRWTEDMPEGTAPALHGHHAAWTALAREALDGSLAEAQRGLEALSVPQGGRRRPMSFADETLTVLGRMAGDEAEALLRPEPEDEAVLGFVT